MAATLTTTAKLHVKCAYHTVKDLSTVIDNLNSTFTLSLADGTDDDEADLLFHDTRSLATGADESLDLAGVLLDSFGSTLTFSKVKFLAIYNKTAGQTLTVGNGAAPFEGWISALGTIQIHGESWAVLIADPVGWPVVAATDDLLKIANSAGATCYYDIIIVGDSA